MGKKKKKNHAWAKDPLKVRARQIDCNVTEYEKFIGRVSDSTW